MLQNLILVASGLIILALCLLILISNARRSVNRTLAAFLFSGFTWLLTNLLTNVSSAPTVALWFARSTAAAAVLLPYTFLLFCISYSRARKLSKQLLIKSGILPLIILLLTPTSLNIVSSDANGKNVVAGPLYDLLVITIVLYFGLGFYYLFRLYKHANSVQKSQLSYIFIGSFLTVLPALITNGLLPALGYSEGAFLGPSVVVIISVFMTWAIIKHGLLDIKLIVARAVTYIFLLGTLGLLFGFGVFGFTGLFFKNAPQSLALRSIYVLMAIALAFALGPLKNFFDKLTNKFFYQDAYDPQELLDKLNKILVSTYELKPLLNQTSSLLEQELKTLAPFFIIKETIGEAKKFISTNGKLTEEAVQDIIKTAEKIDHQVIAVDYLQKQEEQQATLNTYKIALVAKLVTTTSSSETIGYLVMGSKKSGNIFNYQDINVITIIANELVIAIQNALRFEEIEQFNLTLQQKVDDATRKLRQTNEKLKELDESKDEFISMASHQLRTPLTSMKGYVSMVLDGDTGKITAKQQEMLKQAFDSSQRMVYLIADLLNVSRLRTGKFVIENKPTNLADVITGEMSQLTETAKTRKLSLTYEKPKDFPMLMMDETKIRQVVMNFIDNAIYYTPAEGHIVVALKDGPESVEFTVTDDGIGIPKHEQHHLFTKFYRAGNAKKARPDGTGLGLFMAKKVIVAQGGALLFKSEEGKGSTFGFTLPKGKLKVTAVAQAASTATAEKAPEDKKQ